MRLPSESSGGRGRESGRQWGDGMALAWVGGYGGDGGNANSNMYTHSIRIWYYLHELFNFEILNLVLLCESLSDWVFVCVIMQSCCTSHGPIDEMYMTRKLYTCNCPCQSKQCYYMNFVIYENVNSILLKQKTMLHVLIVHHSSHFTLYDIDLLSSGPSFNSSHSAVFVF